MYQDERYTEEKFPAELEVDPIEMCSNVHRFLFLAYYNRNRLLRAY